MWLIIGYGNSLRGDDAAGPTFVEALRRNVPDAPARFLCSHQILPEMVEELIQPQIARVLFVDAQRQQAPYLISPMAAEIPTQRSITHRHDPQWLLAMAEKLYNQPRQGVMLTLAAINFEHGDPLSATTKDAIELALPVIEKLMTA
jgi:hydrogenase maturation protease